MISLPQILTVLLYSTLPGALGGFVAFLFGVLKDEYKNNRYLIKFSIEMLGAMITASFISILFESNTYRAVISFVLGVGWVGIIQVLRIKITKVVEATFGEKIDSKSNL